MKHSRNAHSVTSAPQAPKDENRTRVRTYTIMMGIRMLCFLLMALVTPYGWYTWVFAAGAIFLPYFAVVIANVAGEAKVTVAESPTQALEAARSTATVAPETDLPPTVIRIDEKSTGDDAS